MRSLGDESGILIRLQGIYQTSLLLHDNHRTPLPARAHTPGLYQLLVLSINPSTYHATKNHWLSRDATHTPGQRVVFPSTSRLHAHIHAYSNWTHAW
jgi:hypothetical protein